jgi:hypothetical protein
VIYAGIIAGFVAYYWLMPKWVAARIVRHVEALNRAANPQTKRDEK